MAAAELPQFFLQLAVMLAVALVFGQLARRVHLPAVMGELIGGILLGPTAFGALAPAFWAWLFPADGFIVVAQQAVIRLGMLFFLFAAGLEVDLIHLRQQGARVVLTSLLGIVLPLGMGIGMALALPDLWGPRFEGGRASFALLMGTALSISALPVIARTLMDLSLTKEAVGLVIISAATIDDLVGWLLFALVLNSYEPQGVMGRSIWLSVALLLGLFALILGMGRLVGRRVLGWMQRHVAWPSGFIGVSAVVLLSAAALAEGLGMHAVFVAFLVGVSLSPGPDGNSADQQQAHDVVRHFAVSFFAPVYFVSIGLRTDFIAHFDGLLVLLIIVVACAGKIGGAALGARLGGMLPREALAVGFGLNARGAIEIILASVALEHGLIDERIFVALVVMALVTSVLSGPAIQRLLGRSYGRADG